MLFSFARFVFSNPTGVPRIAVKVLEYKDPGKQRPWLIKKLKAMGVHQNAKATSVHPSKRRWARW
jgi:hypothetical protein